jgi:two-component system, chemotaxis family, CheB/CheR fusion protein
VKKTARDKNARSRASHNVIRNTRATRRPATPQSDAPAKAPAGAHVDAATATAGPLDPSFPIVGIGASAGGLDAFAELLSEVPVNAPLGLVLVQHLDPTHESALVELLARTTRMPVVEAKHGTRVEPARVYVIPPNASMTIAGGVLHLAPRERGAHTMAIDHFLRSLAEDCGGRSIGVILSGTASDGALGLTAIKAAGGLTFAQDPDSAKYDGMPRSAVARGAVDIVLPAAAIGRELARLAAHPNIRWTASPAPAEASVDDQASAGIFRILQRETGVDFAQYRQTMVRRRIARRMIVHKLDTLEAYHRYLEEHAAEAPALCSDLLINVTSFFRDADTFRVLQQTVFPGLVKRRAGAPIRVWVPACATGEEAYSLAITLLESLGAAPGPPLIQIFGTDLSETAITHARAGVYARHIELDVSPERLRRFFIKLDGQYQVSKSVRELCVFAKHDLAQDPPFSRVDVISCRNVLIYLEAALQKRVMSVLHYALKNEGVLLLGAAETVSGFADLFTVVDRQHRLFRKKATSVRLDARPPGSGRAVEKPGAGQTPDRSAPRPGGEEDLQRQVDRIVLSRYAPAGVVINDAMEILQFRGRTSPYLEPAPGQASLNLLKMAREGLLTELRQAIARARKTRAPVRREGLRIKQEETFAEVNLEVIPVTGPGGELNYLVLFEDVVTVSATRPSRKAAGAARASRARTAPPGQIESLRRELTATKEFLQSIIEEREAANEELRSANEEILSSNEELQSTSEEMETAKEELQSANEELTTVMRSSSTGMSSSASSTMI